VTGGAQVAVAYLLSQQHAVAHQLHGVWALLILFCAAKHHQVFIVFQLVICCCRIQASDFVKLSYVFITLRVRTAVTSTAAAAAAAAAADSGIPASQLISC
jgi:hypothetical protein